MNNLQRRLRQSYSQINQSTTVEDLNLREYDVRDVLEEYETLNYIYYRIDVKNEFKDSIDRPSHTIDHETDTIVFQDNSGADHSKRISTEKVKAKYAISKAMGKSVQLGHAELWVRKLSHDYLNFLQKRGDDHTEQRQRRDAHVVNQRLDKLRFLKVLTQNIQRLGDTNSDEFWDREVEEATYLTVRDQKLEISSRNSRLVEKLNNLQESWTAEKVTSNITSSDIYRMIAVPIALLAAGLYWYK